MIDSADYTPDGKFLVMPSLYGQQEPVKVPVALLDELIERKLSSYALERLLFVRTQTAGVKTRKVPLSELVGQDLTGKTVGIYFRNWQDSEWISTGKAVSVAKHEDGGYHFTFPESYNTCYDGECGHYDDEDNPEDCLGDELQGMYFSAGETVLVTDKEAAA